MVFELLDKEVAKLVNGRFEKPTPTQTSSIPLIVQGKNILLIGPVGSGKTESAMLPIFSNILKEKPKPVSTLYITPLKSLNRDLLDRLMWWAEKLDIDISVRHGDTSAYERKMQVEFPPQMLITTLETLQPILTGKNLRELLKNVKWVVLDEVHETADSKRGTQLAIGLERLKELCGDFQLIMLSATVGEPQKVAQFFAGGREVQVVKAVAPKRMEIKVINPRAKTEDSEISRRLFCSVETAARLRTITELIGQHRSVLAFTNTREFAEILASRIRTLDKKFPAGIHHGSLSKNVRIATEKDFKAEKIKAIIATSSLQLGIDIGSVDLTLQYMSPRQVSQLIQRVGRSGHEMERTSKGIIISTDIDDIFESAVIARKALAEELEPITFHENSFDVLAHQIVGLTLDQWDIETEKAYQIVKRAYPYRNLTYEQFMKVCKILQQLGLVFLNGHIRKKRRGFQYYFEQISTIPTTKQYRIFNTLDNSYVGVLDEEFIALHGQANTTFIVKGEPWKIIDVTEDKVLVEPNTDAEAAIPGWEGELIPVPFSVAQEVGKLREIIAENLDRLDVDLVDKLTSLYPVDESSAKKMINIIKKQKKESIVPTDKTVLVEDQENVVVLHTSFGTKVNETLGRFITALLTSRVGSVGFKADPYRIIIQFQQKNVELIKQAVFENNPNFLQSILELSLSKSNLFEWKFVHVAKRFGAMATSVEYGKVKMKRIIDDYAGSPIYQETLQELENEKLDIEGAVEALRKIQAKEIKLIFKHGLSPLGKIGVKNKFAEVIGPDKPDREIFKLYKNRLMGTKVRMICLNCGQWHQAFIIEELPDDLKCGKCEARLLAVTRDRDPEIVKVIKSMDKKSAGEDWKVDRLRKTAELFINYGRKAAIALAAKGVGPVTAIRVLAKYHATEDDLLRDLLEAERAYIKNKKYWKV